MQPYSSPEKRANEVSPLQLPSLVRAQAALLEIILRNELNLISVQVNTSIKTIPAESLKNTLTLGISGDDDINIAMLAATPKQNTLENHLPMLPMLLLPTPWGLPIKIDETTGALFADGFWTVQDNIYQYVRPSQPVQLDGLLRFNDPFHEFGQTAIIDGNEQFYQFTEDKQRVKEILQAAGISTPPGIFIAQTEQATLESTLHSLENVFNIREGFVVKGNTGSQGRNVKMFGKNELKEAQEYAESLFAQGLDIIIEKRIIPADIPVERRQHRAKLLERADHNTRVITTISATDAEVIDAEERFAEMSNMAVNISQGAYAARLTEVYQARIIDQIEKISIRATHALCKALGIDPTQPLMGIIGHDLITDIHGKTWVIESNSGSVGGFSTLTKLDGKPLQSVTEIFYPYTATFLSQHHANRLDHVPNNLKPIEINLEDKISLMYMYASSKDFDNVAKIARSLPEDNEYMESVIEPLTQHAYWLVNHKYPQEAKKLHGIIQKYPPETQAWKLDKLIAIAENPDIPLDKILGKEKKVYLLDFNFMENLLILLLRYRRETDAKAIINKVYAGTDKYGRKDTRIIVAIMLAHYYDKALEDEADIESQTFYRKRIEELRSLDTRKKRRSFTWRNIFIHNK